MGFEKVYDGSDFYLLPNCFRSFFPFFFLSSYVILSYGAESVYLIISKFVKSKQLMFIWIGNISLKSDKTPLKCDDLLLFCDVCHCKDKIRYFKVQLVMSISKIFHSRKINS